MLNWSAIRNMIFWEWTKTYHLLFSVGPYCVKKVKIKLKTDEVINYRPKSACDGLCYCLATVWLWCGQCAQWVCQLWGRAQRLSTPGPAGSAVMTPSHCGRFTRPSFKVTRSNRWWWQEAWTLTLRSTGLIPDPPPTPDMDRGKNCGVISSSNTNTAEKPIRHGSITYLNNY